MHFSTSVAALAAAVPLVAAHGYVSQVKTGSTVAAGTNPNWFYQPAGTDNSGVGWKALDQDNGFVADPSTVDIACHKSALESGHSFTAAAGAPIAVSWNTWPESHVGPVLNYMAPVSDFKSPTPASLKFFKISATGYANGKWGADAINAASNYTSSVTIPSAVKPGNYILRHEIIALHSAGSAGGAQFYPQCLNVVVTGSGTIQPAGVAATTFYKATDPGVLFDVYSGDLTRYVVPGPAVPASLAGKAAKRFAA